MHATRLALLTLATACALGACTPARRVGRDAQPDTDPLEANRPATSPAQRPLTPILTE